MCWEDPTKTNAERATTKKEHTEVFLKNWGLSVKILLISLSLVDISKYIFNMFRVTKNKIKLVFDCELYIME